MELYNVLFPYFFLPVFMLIYALIPAKRRPLLIFTGNLLFISAADWRGAAVYFALLLTAYFSGIAIYNGRAKKDGEKPKLARRRLVLAGNALLCGAAFLIFAHGGALAPNLPYGLKLFGAGVIAAHIISYLTDVYRGDCEAQTKFSALAAYTGFFPSLGFGPILKYKNFRKTFAEPKVTLEKTAEGVRCYITGLAEYLMIAEPLSRALEDVKKTDFESVRGAPAWLAVMIFCACFCTTLNGMLNMGRGAALMLGFPVKPAFRRRIFKDGVKNSVREMNIPLYEWSRDYIATPLRRLGGRGGKAAACCGVLVSVTAAVMWYGFTAGWLVCGLILSAAMIAETAGAGRKMPKTLRKTLSAAIMFICGAAAYIPQAAQGRGLLKMLNAPAAGTQNGYIEYLAGISVPLIIMAIFTTNSIIPTIFKRAGAGWYRVAFPVIELVLLMICTAYMIY